MIRHHNKTHPARPKIGGVADIGGDVDEADVADNESSPNAGSTSSSQGRFRVVPSKGAVDGGGIGPTRGNKDRRAIRKGHSTVQVA
jgi:hypothetical protein